MEENKYTFRAVNPHDEEDFKKYLILREDLNKYLKTNIGPLTENHIKWMRIRMGATELLPDYKKDSEYVSRIEEKPDEMCFVCEINGEAVGYIQIATYHLDKNNNRLDDDIGIIGEIYVKPEHRKIDISLQLLKLGVQKLIECGKFRAICNVQEDNKYRFLHFAMADGNVVHKDECKRKDGSTTIDYTLMIDLKKLHEDISKGKFVRRVGKYHMQMLRNEKELTM